MLIVLKEIAKFLDPFFTAKLFEISTATLFSITAFYLRVYYKRNGEVVGCALYEKDCSLEINSKVVYIGLPLATTDFILRQCLSSHYPVLKNKILPIADIFFDIVGMHGFFANNLFWLAAEIPALVDREISSRGDEKRMTSNTTDAWLISIAALLAIVSNPHTKLLLRRGISKLLNTFNADWGNWPDNARGILWRCIDFATEWSRGTAMARGWIITSWVLATHKFPPLTPLHFFGRTAIAGAWGLVPAVASYYHAPHIPNQAPPTIKLINSIQNNLSVIFYGMLLGLVVEGVSEHDVWPALWSIGLLIANLLLCCCPQQQAAAFLEEEGEDSQQEIDFPEHWFTPPEEAPSVASASPASPINIHSFFATPLVPRDKTASENFLSPEFKLGK